MVAVLAIDQGGAAQQAGFSPARREQQGWDTPLIIAALSAVAFDVVVNVLGDPARRAVVNFVLLEPMFLSLN